MRKIALYIMLLVCFVSVADSKKPMQMKITIKDGKEVRYWISNITNITFVNGEDYVDLGLSVKWATCNVGADVPWEYGDYFSWGETSTKSSYDSGNYTYTDDPDCLPVSADAALKNCGYDWRMPTMEELLELKNNCTWTWTTDYEGSDVAGYIVTSNIDGYTNKSIFLPASGYYDSNNLNNDGAEGYYWSSNINKEKKEDALMLHFTDNTYEQKGQARYIGLCVRPVSRADQREADKLAFQSYKVSQKIVANSYLKEDDGDGAKSLVSSAISQIETLPFDELKSLDQNKVEVDKILGTLYVDLDSWRAANFPHESVDLGLSVKWATCNIGAKTPEKFGNYYSWGELTTKMTYRTDNYTYTDNPNVLPASADAATNGWGDDWRMPTIEECGELIDNCKWTWTDNYNETNVAGYIVTSKKEGFTDKSIFLPAAGKKMDYPLDDGYGFYWSSSRENGNTYCLRFATNELLKNPNDRYEGISIRPVSPKN